MTRDDQPVPGGGAGPDEGPDEGPSGHLRPVPAGLLSVLGIVGMAAGWGGRKVVEAVSGATPLVTWAQPLVLLVAGAGLLLVAGVTWRQVQSRQDAGRAVDLEPRLAVNRLVLARASALVGALVCGGYTGFAVSWLGDASARADDQVVRSLVAVLGAGLVLLGGLLLERACRARTRE